MTNKRKGYDTHPPRTQNLNKRILKVSYKQQQNKSDIMIAFRAFNKHRSHLYFSPMFNVLTVKFKYYGFLNMFCILKSVLLLIQDSFEPNQNLHSQNYDISFYLQLYPLLSFYIKYYYAISIFLINLRSKTLCGDTFFKFPSHNKLDMLQILKKTYYISIIYNIWVKIKGL